MGFGSVVSSIGNAVSGATKGLGGALIGGAANLIGGYWANQANAGLASDQMKFQARMSNTSYQRAVKDMLAAGLNPMLAYGQGGASTPSGSMARMENPVKDAVENFYRAKQVNSAINLQDAQADQSATQADLNSAQSVKSAIETIKTIKEFPGLDKVVEKMEADIKAALAGAESHSAASARTRQVIDASRPAAASAGGFMDLFHSAQEAAKTIGDNLPTWYDVGDAAGNVFDKASNTVKRDYRKFSGGR